MTINTMERVLWDLHNDASLATKFHENSEEVLNAYNLADDERSLVKEMDVRAMADQGVSQMLMFMAWQALKGPQLVPEYMRRLNTPPQTTSA